MFTMAPIIVLFCDGTWCGKAATSKYLRIAWQVLMCQTMHHTRVATEQWYATSTALA